MKAVFCEKLGSPDDLVIREIASPTPEGGQVKVALRARGVSFVDVLTIAGQYHVKRALPLFRVVKQPVSWWRQGPAWRTFTLATACWRQGDARKKPSWRRRG